MERRHFVKAASILGIAGTMPAAASGTQQHLAETQKSTGAQDRKYWADLLYRISAPILYYMSKGELKKNMLLDVSPKWDNRDKNVSYLEAFGRLTAGTSLWFSLPDDQTPEGEKRKQLYDWTLQSMAHAVDPSSPDYLAWTAGSQPLVDAAFLAHGLIRNMPKLWEPLDNITKGRVIKEFKEIRRVKPYNSNWLLFGAMPEIFLLLVDEEYNTERIEHAINKINGWYVGDGWYSDGDVFHMDYYNSYVIQPMLVDILDVWINKAGKMPQSVYETAFKRMQRYSEFLERIISPEGTFPAFGRSITYRVGAFQPLAQMAYLDKLPKSITPAQVRCGLTAVMKRMFANKNNFDKNNFLQLGFVGHQPNVADSYTNTGSLYLTSLGFLPLGLPADHEFWSAPAADWTAKKAWNGEDFPKDAATRY
ncbi:MAG: DUF2264 domain-containing protein [Bacteroidales bacterium]|jgi:hypothetical protein|nr:DUF2264 domain-containing protein [Bacteroidales bacterium]